MMNQLRRMVTSVSVATVWTSPESPRVQDEPALCNPVDLKAWLGEITIPERLDFCSSNRIQTQLLYGTEVIVTEEQGEWSKVLIPSQGTRKSEEGYPGWVPTRQLAEATEHSKVELWAEVVADKAMLYSEATVSGQLFELSFLTRLPVSDRTKEWVQVYTPGGRGYLRLQDVRLRESNEDVHVNGHKGNAMVEQGKRFLGLPYLWGGMSSFGYDCSGFAYNMHRYLGITITRDASDQSRHGQSIDSEMMEPGDLLFFAYEEGKGNVHHVGMYAGDGMMIHSPDSNGCVEMVVLDDTYRLIKELCVIRRYW